MSQVLQGGKDAAKIVKGFAIGFFLALCVAFTVKLRVTAGKSVYASQLSIVVSASPDLIHWQQVTNFNYVTNKTLILYNRPAREFYRVSVKFK